MYLVDFADGPCSGVKKIHDIQHFWFLRSGKLWYYYRLESKLTKVQTEDEVGDKKKVNSVKKYNPYSRAKNRHDGVRVYLPIQARYVYVPGAVQNMDENHCDVVTFLNWVKREFGVEYNGE